MCVAVEIGNQRFGCLAEFRKAGFVVLPEDLVDPVDPDYPDLVPLTPDAVLTCCFCTADPEPVLTRAGYTWTFDDIGDYIAVRPTGAP